MVAATSGERAGHHSGWKTNGSDGRQRNVAVRHLAGGEVLTVEGNEPYGGLAALAPDGDTLAVVTATNLRFRSLDRGEWVGQPIDMVSNVTAAVFTLDGRTLAFGDQNGTIRLWIALVGW